MFNSLYEQWAKLPDTYQYMVQYKDDITSRWEFYSYSTPMDIEGASKFANELRYRGDQRIVKVVYRYLDESYDLPLIHSVTHFLVGFRER